MPALALLAALIGAAAAPAQTSAAPPLYLRTTTCPNNDGAGRALWWGPGLPAVHWSLSSHHVPAGCQDLPTLQAHVISAFGRWPSATLAGGSSPCTNFAFVFDGTTAGFTLGNDGQNRVAFRQGYCADLPASDPCHAANTCGNLHNCWEQGDALVLALTWASFDSGSGRIVDADIELHDWNGLTGSATHGYTYTCSDGSKPACGGNADVRAAALGCTYADVDAIVTHESGHVLGLDHPCPPGVQDCGPVMSPNVYLDTRAIAKRQLTADDVAGVCAIYPAGSAGAVQESLPGTCDGGTTKRGCGCGGEPGALSWLLLPALLLRPGRSRRRKRGGQEGPEVAFGPGRG